jgi:hypothetical protein
MCRKVSSVDRSDRCAAEYVEHRLRLRTRAEDVAKTDEYASFVGTACTTAGQYEGSRAARRIN